MPDLTLKSVHQLSDVTLFYGFGAVTIISILTAIALYSPLPLLLPLGIMGALLSFIDTRIPLYLFFGLLPFSIEVQFGSLGTDLPTEPVLLVLTGLFFLVMLTKYTFISQRVFTHPISLIILAHVGWIAVASVFSENHLVSFKYLAAKIWYVVPLYFLPLAILKKNNFRGILMLLTVTLAVAVMYVMLRHGMNGFSFKTINASVRPIFRNHVNYAVMLVAFLPFLWHLAVSSQKGSLVKVLLWSFVGILILAIYLTYTRAAHISVLLLVAIYFIVRFRLLKYALLTGAIIITGIVTYLVHDNTYLDYAPNYERTVAHYKFDNLVEATTKMEDISTVERLYRWIAGFYMVGDKPLTGHGPSTFYPAYKRYTVSSFKTYVSDNPEKSGIHNNYLMVFVEQGVVGFIIMIFLAIVPLLIGENTYHRLGNKRDRSLVMSAVLSFAIIGIIILINDLIEADKVGALYFFSAAIITWISLELKAFKTTS